MIETINVVDLEFECWEGRGPGNIIQIGICEIETKTLQIKKKMSFFVGNYELSDFCLRITNINKYEYKAKSLPIEICSKILYNEYRFHKNHWVSWGDTDRVKLRKENIKMGPHTNLRNIYEIKTFIRAKSLFKSMIDIGMSPIGHPHNAMDDAFNCALLYREILYGRSKG